MATGGLKKDLDCWETNRVKLKYIYSKNKNVINANLLVLKCGGSINFSRETYLLILPEIQCPCYIL